MIAPIAVAAAVAALAMPAGRPRAPLVVPRRGIWTASDARRVLGDPIGAARWGDLLAVSDPNPDPEALERVDRMLWALRALLNRPVVPVVGVRRWKSGPAGQLGPWAEGNAIGIQIPGAGWRDAAEIGGRILSTGFPLDLLVAYPPEQGGHFEVYVCGEQGCKPDRWIAVSDRTTGRLHRIDPA